MAMVPPKRGASAEPPRAASIRPLVLVGRGAEELQRRLRIAEALSRCRESQRPARLKSAIYDRITQGSINLGQEGLDLLPRQAPIQLELLQARIGLNGKIEAPPQAMDREPSSKQSHGDKTDNELDVK